MSEGRNSQGHTFFKFLTLPLIIPDKTKLHARKLCKHCATSLAAGKF